MDFDSDSSCVGCGWLSDSPRLTGDWGGKRTALEESGVVLKADMTLFYMGVASGGVSREFRFSGHGDYTLLLNTSKLGGPQGLTVKLRAEHHFGQPMLGTTGALLPSNVTAVLPVSDSEELYLVNALLLQQLSKSLCVFVGKLDTLDGDANDFAHGRGKTQFLNMAFVGTPIVSRTVPYCTLGAGFMYASTDGWVFNFAVLNARDTTRTSGLDELFAHGVVLVPELRVPTRFFGLPGHQLIAASFSTSKYVALQQDPRVILPHVPLAEHSSSWAVVYNFDQYLFAEPTTPTRGWGVFGRFGIADADTSIIEWFLSFGIGGISPLRKTKTDRFGIGWYYAAASSKLGPLLTNVLGMDDGQGVELFYNFEVTPAFHLTADMQIIDPGATRADTALLVGLRAHLDF